MPDISDKFVVLTITKDETRVWATGVERGKLPKVVYAPPGLNTHHFRDGSNPRRSGDGPGAPRYYEDIVWSIGGATEILLIGHGIGQASAMLHFMQYLTREHADLAIEVVDALYTNLTTLTEIEILSMTQNWFNDSNRSKRAEPIGVS